VAVRVVLAHHVTDDTTALLEAGPRRQSHLLHPEQDAALHRLQPVARVRKRPRDDDRHRVVEVRRTHLILDATRRLSGWRWNFVDHVPTFSRLHSAGLAPTARR